MKSLLTIPFPRKPLSSYVGIVVLIGLVVNFILIVFQPFGTSSFEHPHKYWILMGYGCTIALAGALYYTVSFYILKRNGENKWNILSEVLDLFISCIISILATYFYYKFIFGGGISLRSLFSFLGLASTVALLPILISLAYLYFTWKDVTASTIESDDNEPGERKDQLTLITGQNKSDRVETVMSDLICGKAQDNYVMLFIKESGRIQKHLIRSSLKKIIDQVDTEIFIQTHRSYFVNRNLILQLTGNKSKAALVLSDFDKNIPVSRSMYDNIKSIVTD